MGADIPPAPDRRGHVEPGLEPPPHHPRFPLLDGLRGLAVLGVVLVHTHLLATGTGSSLGDRLLAHLNLGVTVFFLISGFLLYRPMIAHRGRGASPPPIRHYLARRALRILPAYWAALSILALLGGLQVLTGRSWWAMYSLLHTLPLYRGPSCSSRVLSCGLAQTWSLVVELTFYLVLPLWAVALERATRSFSRRGWAAAQLLALLAASAASVWIEFRSPAVPAWVGGSVAGYVLWFAAGMGVAVISVVSPVRPPGTAGRLRGWPTGCWGAALAGYVALSVLLPPTPFLLARGQRLAVHLCFAGLALLVLVPGTLREGDGGLPGRVLRARGIVWLGVISYGVFLWHYALALKLGIAGAHAAFPVELAGTLAGALAAAALSYYLLERPLLRLKQRPPVGIRTFWRGAQASGP